MKEQTLEEFINSQPYYGHGTPEYLEGIEVGAKWQAERMYSEEELRNAMNWMLTQYLEFYEQPTTGRIDYYIQSLKQQEQ
jgi:hypothetical protein